MLLEKISKISWYASLFCVLVVLPSTFFPFIGGKYAFFRVAVEISLAFFLLAWAFEMRTGDLMRRVRELLRQPIVIAVTVFIGVYMLATVLAYDPMAAFWSNYERGDGAFQMLHYYAFFALALLLFREKKDWIRAMQLSLVAAGLMIIYGILATMSVNGFVGPYSVSGSTLGFWDRLLQARFQGSLGNPSYVAPYLMFIMAYAAYLWLQGNLQSWKRGIAYGALIAFLLFFFVLTQTRGAYLGLGAAVVAFALLSLFFWPQGRKWVGIGFGVLACVFVVLAIYRHTAFVQALPGSRFLSLIDTRASDPTVSNRIWTWGSAWAGFKERPILGWGPENFSVVFDRHFNPNHFSPVRGGETWFDRAHNVVFDTLVQTGIVGLLSYLALIGTVLSRAFRNALQSASRRVSAEWAIFAALMIGYLVQALALFDVLAIYINFFMLLGYLAFSASSISNLREPSSGKNRQ